MPGCFALLGHHPGEHFPEDHAPLAPSRPLFPPWEVWTHPDEMLELRPNTVNLRFAVTFPYSTDTPIFCLNGYVNTSMLISRFLGLPVSELAPGGI